MIAPLEKQGLKALQEKPNGSTLAAAYWKIVEGVEKTQAIISLEDDLYPLAVEDIQMVYLCYRNDYPQHFWVDTQYSWSYYSNGIAQSLSVTYLLTGPALESAKAEFESSVQEILSLIDPGMSQYEMELTIHDAIISRCSYQEAPFAHCAYGALVQGKAVCEGYAEAFQYLLNQAGINCIIVSGYAGEPHAWNAVQIDGLWYYTDATWDDPIPPAGEAESIWHGYFNLTQAQMDKDHIAYEEYIPLPEATSTKHFYYTLNGRAVDAFDAEQFAMWFKDSDTVSIYVTGDMDSFIQAFGACFFDIVDCRSYSYTCSNFEIKITVTR